MRTRLCESGGHRAREADVSKMWSMLCTLSLSSPAKNATARSVRSTSFSIRCFRSRYLQATPISPFPFPCPTRLCPCQCLCPAAQVLLYVSLVGADSPVSCRRVGHTVSVTPAYFENRASCLGVIVCHCAFSVLYSARRSSSTAARSLRVEPHAWYRRRYRHTCARSAQTRRIWADGLSDIYRSRFLST